MLGAATAIGSAGLAAGGTAGALLGAELAGTDAAAGLPLGLLVAGSAIAALLISSCNDRLGRGRSLAAGYLAGAAGGAAVIGAAIGGSLTMLLAGSVLLGGANASVFFTRYAAAEVSVAGATGRGLGWIFFSTAIGAVAGPLLLGPSGDVADAVGLPRLSGLYVVAVVAFGAAALTLGTATKLSGASALRRPPSGSAVTLHEIARGVRTPPAREGLVVLVAANFAMVAVMAVAPIHLMGHGHDVEMIGTVVAFHVAGMFAPSPLSGRLVDRSGPRAVASAGLVIVLASAIGGAMIDRSGASALTATLIVLGIGWNFSVVGGSALIAGSVRPALRVQVEGAGEAAMGFAAAGAAPVAGLILAFGGWPWVWVAGALAATAALAVVRADAGPPRPTEHAAAPPDRTHALTLPRPGRFRRS